MFVYICRMNKEKITGFKLVPIGMNVNETGQLCQDYKLEIQVTIVLSSVVKYIECREFPFEKTISE